MNVAWLADSLDVQGGAELTQAEFRAAAEKLVASSRGTMVPASVFDQAVQERDAYRKTKGK